MISTLVGGFSSDTQKVKIKRLVGVCRPWGSFSANFSPDFAPAYFWLFGRIKTGLTGRSFAEPEALLEGVREYLERIPAAELTAVFEDWFD
jgi:hypothetical protein